MGQRQPRRRFERLRNHMTESAASHLVSGPHVPAFKARPGCGLSFDDMTHDDSDLFAYAARLKQQPQTDPELEQEPVKKRCIKAKPLPVTLIRESFEIDSTSPTFLRWKTRPRHHFATEHGWNIANAQNAGKPAGSEARRSHTVYYEVGISGTAYLAHRLVWFLAHGSDPGAGFIDHKDGNGLNNHPNNLRLATRVENNRNVAKRSDNTSGVPGVYWYNPLQKWQAQITVQGRRIHLGYFTYLDEAVAARKNAEARYFGSFSHDASRKNKTKAA